MGTFITTLLQALINGSNAIQNFLTKDFAESLGVVGDIFKAVGVDLNGITLIGILGGVGLFALIIYSIIK